MLPYSLTQSPVSGSITRKNKSGSHQIMKPKHFSPPPCAGFHFYLSWNTMPSLLPSQQHRQGSNWKLTFFPRAGCVISNCSDLRAVDNLEPFSFLEAEVIFCPCLVVIKCHKEGDSCRRDKNTVSPLHRSARENKAQNHFLTDAVVAAAHWENKDQSEGHVEFNGNFLL